MIPRLMIFPENKARQEVGFVAAIGSFSFSGICT